VPVAQLRLEESADPGLQQDAPARPPIARLGAVRFLHEQRAARPRGPLPPVRRRPSSPPRARNVSEHRPAVQTLRVPDHRTDPSHPSKIAPCARRATPRLAIRPVIRRIPPPPPRPASPPLGIDTVRPCSYFGRHCS